MASLVVVSDCSNDIVCRIRLIIYNRLRMAVYGAMEYILRLTDGPWQIDQPKLSPPVGDQVSQRRTTRVPLM